MSDASGTGNVGSASHAVRQIMCEVKRLCDCVLCIDMESLSSRYVEGKVRGSYASIKSWLRVSYEDEGDQGGLWKRTAGFGSAQGSL